MQALKPLMAVLLLSALPLLAQTSDWAKVELGEFAVPGACPAVSQSSRNVMQRQQSVASWEAGKVSLSMRAWPDRKLRDRQSIKTFEACAKAAPSRVPAAQLVGAERAAEDALRGAINECLTERQQSFAARIVVLSRSALRC